MKKYTAYLILLLASSCANFRSLPKEHYYPFHYHFSQQFQHDTLVFRLKNPLRCPVNVTLAGDSADEELRRLFGRVVLREQLDTVLKISYPAGSGALARKIHYDIHYGRFDQAIIKLPVAYPFPARRKYRIIQGYHGRFSHQSIQSQFALDFNLRVGDTITCVDNGVVVGLIDGYSQYGTSAAWKPNDRSNYLTVYHPVSGLYSQYVHLQHQGALVKLGEQVRRGQPIALSGQTGFTTKPHLHFSMKYPTERNGLISIAVPFESREKKKQ